MYGCSFSVKLYGAPRIPLILLAVFVILLSCMTQALPLQSDPVHSAPYRGVRHSKQSSGGFTKTIALRNMCSQKLVQVNRRRWTTIDAKGNGSLLTGPPNKFAVLLMKSVGSHDYGYVTIVSNLTKEYLCFSSAGKLIMRAKQGRNCIFKEDEDTKDGHKAFRYSVDATPNTFYIGFRKNGKRLRGNQRTKSAKSELCTYFYKEQKHYIDISLATQDPHAPTVDLDKHWNENGPSPSREEQTNERKYEMEAENHNKPYAPNINVKDGNKIRHNAHIMGEGHVPTHHTKKENRK